MLYLARSKALSALSALLMIGLSACAATSAEDSTAPGAGCGDSSCFNSDAGTDGGASDVSSDIGNSDAAEEAQAINPLCGNGCLPDDPNACGGGGSVPDAGDAGAPDAASAVAEAGFDGAYNKSPKPDMPPAGDLPIPNPDGGGGACQVLPSAGGAPSPKCSVAGDGVDDSPCVSAADCAPGFACVGDAATGQCRPYCCASADSCAPGTWCAERPSRDALLQSPSVQMPLPVCEPGQQCHLLEDPADSICPDGQVCTIVRNDGTLACLAPGTVEEGGACDSRELRCAAGLVCSRSTMTCLKLCVINSDDCGGGVCQAGTTGLPDNIGICVGGASS